MNVEGQGKRKGKMFAQKYPLTIHVAVSVLDVIVILNTGNCSDIAHRTAGCLGKFPILGQNVEGETKMKPYVPN